MKYNAIYFILTCLFSLVFLFSGISKAIDFYMVPQIIDDYANLFNVHFESIFSEIIAIILVSVEIWIGLLWIYEVSKSYATLLSVIFLGFFTSLTLYSAIDGRMDECGCFGSILQSSQWVAFYKNLFLIVLLFFFIYTFRVTKYSRFFPKKLILLFSFSILFSIIHFISPTLYDSCLYKVGEGINNITDDITWIKNDPDITVNHHTILIAKDINDCTINQIQTIPLYNDSKPIILSSSAKSDCIKSSLPFTIGITDKSTLKQIISSKNGIVVINSGIILSKLQMDHLGINNFAYIQNHTTAIYYAKWITLCVIFLGFFFKVITNIATIGKVKNIVA